jgi:hypothetical protein
MSIFMKKEDFKEYCKMQANWWIAYATTGLAKNCDIWYGDGVALSDEEKIQDALNTAQLHIKNFREACEN